MRFGTLRIALAALAIGGLAACDSNAPPPASPAQLTQRDVAAIDAALQSSPWQLVSWQPDQPLEAMFQQLLAQQFATMSIRFQSGRLLADSPSLHVARTYQITDAAGPRFTLVALDDNGVPIRSTAEISEDGGTIRFRGLSEPWLGAGVLRKAQ